MFQLKSPDTTKLQIRLVLKSSDFKDFVYSALQEEKMDLLFQQYKYICDENENNLMDFVGRLESLSEDFNSAFDRILEYNQRTKGNNSSLFSPIIFSRFRKPPNISHKNKSSSKSYGYRDFYDLQLQEKVKKACYNDLKIFGYDFWMNDVKALDTEFLKSNLSNLIMSYTVFKIFNRLCIKALIC